MLKSSTGKVIISKLHTSLFPTSKSPIAVPEEGLQPAVAKSTPAIFQPGKKDHRKKRSSATKDAEAVEKVLPCAEENGGKETETFKQKEKQTQQDVSIKKGELTSGL